MLLEIGKTYKTESGDIVKIIRNDIDLGYHSNQPFFGFIKTISGDLVRLAYFSQNGIYNLYGKSIFNIIEEYDV